MNYAVIEVPSFPLQALLRLEAGLARKPVALVEGEGKRTRVAHITPTAGERGVFAGMGSVQALAECPGLELRTASADAEHDADAMLLLAAWSLSPRVERSASGLCTIDLSGRGEAGIRTDLERVRIELAGQGLDARIGIADTPLTARFAAHGAKPIQWVGDSQSFLATLPVGLLELTESEESLFASLGLRSLGDLTRLPRAAISRRLGLRGDQLWERASGEELRPLHTATPPARFEAHLDLEHPTETLEPLLFVLRRFIDRLSGELVTASLAAETLRFRLRLSDETIYERSFRPPEATTHADILFRVLENHLGTVQTKSEVIGLDLEIQPTRPQSRQGGLFDIALRDPHGFWDTLARAGAVLGTEQVGTPVRLSSHRPDSVALHAPTATVAEYEARASAPARGPLLRRLRPAMIALVELSHGSPSYLRSTLVEGAVVAHRGPFRLSGNWWEGEWAHDEWDVEIGGLGLYRLRRQADRWFIEGVYD